MNTVVLSSVTQINPKGPKRGELKPDDLIDFAPMAALHEDGHMRVTEQRRYSEVSTGFTPFLDGDLLVAKITPCFENNKIGLASISTKQGFGSTEFHVIRCDDARIYNRYLFFLLRHEYVRKAGERKMTGSGGQRRVPVYFLEELEIFLPELSEQKRIADALINLDQVRLFHSQAAEKTETLLEILGDKAFRGEL